MIEESLFRLDKLCELYKLKLTKVSLKELVEANRVFGEKFKDCRDEYPTDLDEFPMYPSTQKRLKRVVDKLSFYVNEEINKEKPLMLGFLEEGFGYEGHCADNFLMPSSPVLKVEVYNLETSFDQHDRAKLILGDYFVFCNLKSRIFNESESGWGNKRFEWAVNYQAITKRTWDKKEEHIHTIVDYKHISRDK